MACIMDEVRDPIHQFIHVSELEARVIDTRPVQRLREIHQLSTGFLVWPGAVHTRFEHALGTMEFAGRAFDAALRNADRDAPAILRALHWSDETERGRARSFVRLAALLHDVGHAPFSHGSERLFPQGIEHEDMSARIILETEIAPELKHDRYGSIDPEVVADIAVGPGHRPGFSDEPTILLAELVTGGVGVDRWDYLLRDSMFSGARYGVFDVERLLESLTITEVSGAPKWAVKSGGQHSVEQMLLARWFMWLNVYTHKTRRILDLHLEEFLQSDLPNGQFPENISSYLALSDSTVFARIKESDEHRHRILERQQFRQVSADFSGSEFDSPESFREFSEDIGLDEYRIDECSGRPFLPGTDDCYMIRSDGEIVSVTDSLNVIRTLRPRWVGRIYVPQEHRDGAEEKVNKALASIGAKDE